jgi:hypothetical protein
MKYPELLKKICEPWPALLLGLAAFLYITGGKILRPTHVDWLMQLDPAALWLGWQFFRHSPALQWPIGASPDYGMEIGSSIVFTDSIPLLAFIFKPFSAFLPDMFQYAGLWIFACFLLQSFFAWKLLTRFTRDRWLPVIASAFFTLAPIALWRLQAHYALFGHWVLLVALYFYFFPRFSFLRWTALLAVAALIHAYLLAMAIAIWTADLWQRSREKELTPGTAIRYFFVTDIFVLLVIWGAGYLMIGATPGTSGFGFYRMNLLSLIDPEAGWSRLLRDQKQGTGDSYEGFNYLGLGMLGLGLIAGYEMVRNRKAVYSPKLLPLIILCAGLFIYAVSNHIGIGDREILTYKLPPIAESVANTFRCSGRMFWPVYYLIYLSIFYLLFSNLERGLAITVCVVMLCIQILDSSTPLRALRHKFSHPPPWSSPMRSPFWSDIARHYNKIIFVLPQNAPAVWMPLSRFAAIHRMAINTGYFARVDPEKERGARMQVASTIVDGQLSPDSLYVFEHDDLWKVAVNQITPSDVAAAVDGFRVIAPKLGDCPECNKAEIASVAVEPRNDFNYQMERIVFSSKGSGRKYAAYGWSVSEEWGMWSDGDAAAIILELPSASQRDLDLLIEGQAFINDKHPLQEIEVAVNGHVLGILKYDGQSASARKLRIPDSVARQRGNRLLVRFKFRDPRSPAELGISSDARKLGLGLVSMQVKFAEP